jgi:hypothetical protein
MAAIMKMTVSWDVAPCSLVEVDRRFRGACYLHSLFTNFEDQTCYKIDTASVLCVRLMNFIQREQPGFSCRLSLVDGDLSCLPAVSRNKTHEQRFLSECFVRGAPREAVTGLSVAHEAWFLFVSGKSRLHLVSLCRVTTEHQLPL